MTTIQLQTPTILQWPQRRDSLDSPLSLSEYNTQCPILLVCQLGFDRQQEEQQGSTASQSFLASSQSSSLMEDLIYHHPLLVFLYTTYYRWRVNDPEVIAKFDLSIAELFPLLGYFEIERSLGTAATFLWPYIIMGHFWELRPAETYALLNIGLSMNSRTALMDWG